jgi:hypothetical protein
MLREILRDLWLCEDCTQGAANDDYSGLDYSYEPDEADWRMKEIEKGLELLGPGLAPDWSDKPQLECLDCGAINLEEQYKQTTDEDGDLFVECQCGSHDVRLRDSGEDEFSTYGCYCCASSLGGRRFRFAQLVFGE